jgi:hypothetical protein
MTAPALIVAAPRSGAGKTTVTLALLAALRRRGLDVQAAKAGPDYIDPAFHTAATGRESVNLDSWAMPPALLDGLMGSAAAESDVLVIEGVMGLFDGIGTEPGRTGATADLAARYDVPVLLVLDVAGQSQSAAALVRGFASHRAGVRIAGTFPSSAGCRAMGRSPFPNVISAWCRQPSTAISTRGWKRSQTWRSAASMSMRSLRSQRRRMSHRADRKRRCRRPACASRWRKTTPSPFSIRM